MYYQNSELKMLRVPKVLGNSVKNNSKNLDFVLNKHLFQSMTLELTLLMTVVRDATHGPALRPPH